MMRYKLTSFFIIGILLSFGPLKGSEHCSWQAENLLVALGYPPKSIERRIRNYGSNPCSPEAQLLVDMLSEKDLIARAERKKAVPEELIILREACENVSTEVLSRQEDWRAARYFFSNPLAVEAYLCASGKGQDKGGEQRREVAGILLHKAVHEEAPLTTIKLLLERGADNNYLDAAGNTLLMRAAEHNRADVVELLLASGADFSRTNAQGMTAFYIALINGSSTMAESFLKRGADLGRFEKSEDTALHMVIQKSIVEPQHYKDIVEFLINRGADVNYAHEGNSLLMLAARDNNVYMAQLLLENGADIDMAPDDLSPLHVAFIHKQHDMVQFLLRKGAQPHLTNERGETLLHAAAKEGRTEDVKELLEAGATPNTRDASGSTPLAEAAVLGYTDIVAAILKHGGWNSLHHRVNGKLPKELAEENGHLAIFDMLDGYY